MHYQEMLENYKTALTEQLDGLEYALELDSDMADSLSLGNAVATLRRAIEVMD